MRAQPHRKQSQHGSKGSETDRRGERAETGKHPTDCAAEAGSDADCDRRDTEVAAEQLWRRESDTTMQRLRTVTGEQFQ